MHRCRVLLMTLIAILFLALPFESFSQPSSPSKVLLTSQKVRAFCDSIVADILGDRPEKLFEKMEASFRNAYDLKRLNDALNNMYQINGKPIEVKFKMATEGQRMYAGGEIKELRKLWYAAKTTKHPYGKCFLFIEVVPDNGSIRSCAVSLVTFPMGVPPELQ